MKLRFVLPLLILAGCSSPPKPPTVDESKRRPANQAQSVELQVCRSELQNSRLGLAEAHQATSAQQAYAQRLAAAWDSVRQAAELSTPAPAEQVQLQANGLFVVHFPYGGTTLTGPPASFDAIVEAARHAPLVMLRGRTDAASDAPVETRIARERAMAVRNLLIGSGIPPDRIRATWQPSGDPLADNSAASGRAANRRVEIEIYRALPVALNPTAETPYQRPPSAPLH